MLYLSRESKSECLPFTWQAATCDLPTATSFASSSSEFKALQGQLRVALFALDDLDELTWRWVHQGLCLACSRPKDLQELGSLRLSESDGLSQGVGPETAAA